MIRVDRLGDAEVKLCSFEWGGLAKRINLLEGFAKIRWSEDLGYGELREIYVLPGKRRDGTGRGLMFSALNYLRRVGIHRVFFELKPDHDLSIEPFLLAMGFEEAGVYNDFRQFMREIPMTGEPLGIELNGKEGA